MDNAQMWALVVGFLLPNLVAIVQQPTWSKPVRALVTGVISLVFGGGTAYFAGDFTGKDIVTCVLIVLVAAISTYKSFWSQLGTTQTIESATSTHGDAGQVRWPTIVTVLLVIALVLVILWFLGIGVRVG